MSIDTPATVRPVPEWAQSIFRASVWGALTPAERALLDALILLMRARSGRTHMPEPKRVARLFISDALAALDRQGGR